MQKDEFEIIDCVQIKGNDNKEMASRIVIRQRNESSRVVRK